MCNFRFCNRHIGIMDDDRRDRNHFVAQPNLGKVTEAHPLTLRGYKMAAKRVAWTVILPRINSEIATLNNFILNCS